ncbi:MAG: hypothetical protein ACJAVI_000007 [Candidatus Azotimanducaceae bacterium]|jgi:hypothetical protein
MCLFANQRKKAESHITIQPFLCLPQVGKLKMSRSLVDVYSYYGS